MDVNNPLLACQRSVLLSVIEIKTFGEFMSELMFFRQNNYQRLICY